MFQWLTNAFSDAPEPSGADRRRDERRPQHGRIVPMKLAGRLSRMRLLNVSTRGASGEVSLPATVGDPAFVAFENGLRVSGVVRSVSGKRIGIEFHQCVPLDVVEGEKLSRERAHRRRYPRVDIDRPVMLSVNSDRFAATVDNLSAGGARLVIQAALVPGQQVTIDWTDGNQQPGQVRWTDDGAAGIMFAVPTACPVEVACEM